MIKLLRIDDRLIHGQVAYAWTRHLGVNHILVANDTIPNDEFRIMSLNLVKPSDVKLLIKNLEDSIAFLNSPDSEKFQILVLVDSSLDALRLADGVKEIKSINVGGIRKKAGKQMIHVCVAVDDNDKNNFKKLIDNGIEVEIRQVPTEGKKLISSLI